MPRKFLSKSFDIAIQEDKRGQASNWLISHKISYQFSAAAQTFKYVKFDKVSVQDFQRAYPEAKVVASAFEISFNW